MEIKQIEVAVKPGLKERVTNRPSRKVTAGAACGGLVTFLSAMLEAMGIVHLPEIAWLGLLTCLTFVVQYVTRDRDE